jgi:methionyl-tRNA formyltransferase
MGTPEFAIPSLERLVSDGHELVAVVTAPDKPRGRGQIVMPTPIKEYALKKSLPVLQPENLHSTEFISQLKSLTPDLIVVVAFKILPKEVFTLPKYGSFNLHASLLPKYRGAAPINWAVINGESITGVTTFFLQEKVDTGNIILQREIKIGENETAGEVYKRLMVLGAEVVSETVRCIESGNVVTKQQDESIATPAPKIFKDDCRIDWNKSAKEVHNFIRGLSPYPAAWTMLGETQFKIFRTQVKELLLNCPPGSIVIQKGSEIAVYCGSGTVMVNEIQIEGRKRMNITDFLRGYSFEEGARFK